MGRLFVNDFSKGRVAFSNAYEHSNFMEILLDQNLLGDARPLTLNCNYRDILVVGLSNRSVKFVHYDD